MAKRATDSRQIIAVSRDSRQDVPRNSVQVKLLRWDLLCSGLQLRLILVDVLRLLLSSLFSGSFAIHSLSVVHNLSQQVVYNNIGQGSYLVAVHTSSLLVSVSGLPTLLIIRTTFTSAAVNICQCFVSMFHSNKERFMVILWYALHTCFRRHM